MISIDIASNSKFGLPALIWEGASALKRVHRVWQLMMHGRLYANPDNYYGLLVGELCSTSSFLKNVSIPFYVAARLLDLYEQETAWRESKIRFFEALKGVHPVHLKEFPIKETRSGVFLSGHMLARLNVKLYKAQVRVQRIALSSLDLSLQSFQLLMRAMDVIELFSMEWPRLAEISAKKVGIDAPRCLSVLIDANNKNSFLTKVRCTAMEIAGMGLCGEKDSVKAQEYADQLSKGLECFLMYYQMTSGIFGQAISMLIKQGIYDWSPEFVKDKLKEFRLDPESMQRKIKLANLKNERLGPPVEVMIYSFKQNPAEISPVKSPQSKSVPRSPVKPIAYILKSQTNTPKFTYLGSHVIPND